MPDLTERMSANIAKKESDKGSSAADNQGAIYHPCTMGLASKAASVSV
ncbi:hypothetical protein [Rhizobium wenxiniae]|nr:hypothetical protein [Rhizobium wenxiniae]